MRIRSLTPGLRIRPCQQPTRTLFRRGLSHVHTVNEPFHSIDVAHFRRATDDLTKPLALYKNPDDTSKPYFPAQEKWFVHEAPDGRGGPVTPYLADFSHLPFPYELMVPQPSGGEDAVSLFITWLSKRTSLEEKLLYEVLLPLESLLAPPGAPPAFHQLHAPLSLLLSALRFNEESPHPLRTLYIAQSPISDLPPSLSSDLPTPHLVQKAGKGDIYASSIWMGLEPTYTPLHRDPNPNLFVQLRGAKTVRLLAPSAGDALYREVRNAVGRGGGSSRIRGADMMGGPERDLLHERVWGDGRDLLEVTVRAGDALFVPLGYWHSVRSEGTGGGLNSSVNWWFR
ncbi:uncharacterized protein DNG_02070 [Cephalotrichum gorgonifer]|uniref:JmjC domain-containing protein n=1 Tax=Cephalotrichum gorgonifer TaxID=2041049 RepID=A0AAE8MTT4_9PEZI|nr:uncharacterized protein DNG_02070 [Cephalotrichum gorgonifer]